MSGIKTRGNVLWAAGCVLMLAALGMVFLYVPTEKETGVIQRIFYFHVALAWVSFLAFLVVFISSILFLRKRSIRWDTIANASAEVGILFTTLVLITGPIWARPVWGVWWTWDARLTTTLVLWLTYAAYLLIRSYTADPERGARSSAVLGIVGFINVPIVFLSVNLWRTQHPGTMIFEGGLTGSMFLTLIVSIAAFTLLYVILVSQMTYLKWLECVIRELKREYLK
jgi:heme exporter protein C